MRRGFTLIEIMIVIGILGMILSIAGPLWIRQRTLSRQRVCQQNLAQIDGAKEMWAMQNMMGGAALPDWTDLISADGTGFIKKVPECPADGDYTIGNVATRPRCNVTVPLDHNDRD